MRLLALLLLLTLTACAENSDEVAENLASEEVTTAEVPELPEAAAQLVGTWRSDDDRVVTFSPQGTVISPIMGDGEVAFRLAADSLFLSDSEIFSVDVIDANRRYVIESLAGDVLTLGPAGLAISGTYNRVK